MEQPKWYEYMLYELKFLGDRCEHQRNEIIDAVADMMGLTDKLRLEELESGVLIYRNRAGWALTYLKQSQLIEATKRAVFKITSLGVQLLDKNPKTIDIQDLEQYPGYKDFKNRTKISKKSNHEIDDNPVLSPDEMIEYAEMEYKGIACNELLYKLRNLSNRGFEKVVVKLLVAMGYGDKEDPNCGFVVGHAGDGGIDGVINQDKLGINRIYIQAKKYAENNKVSPHDIRDFGGALVGVEGNNAKTGIFITTSDYTKEGVDYAKAISSNTKIILINGKQLAEYMYQYGVGVSEFKTITLKKTDNDFFDDDSIC